MAAFLRRGRIVTHSLVIGVLFAATQASVLAASSVTLAWTPSTDTNVIGYNVYYGGASGNYTNKVSTPNTTQSVIPNLAAGATYYFAATAFDNAGGESPYSNEASYKMPDAIQPVITNKPPTLNVLGNLTLNNNPGLQTVSLSGISSGSASENQPLTVTVISSNPALIPSPTVNYASPNTTGSITFTPASNASGTANLSVTVNDGQSKSNTITRTFSVTVNAANKPPTLNTLNNLVVSENSGAQWVTLSGISSGAANESQLLTVTAISSNPTLIPTPSVNYASPNTTGAFTFTPVANKFGTATISVTVNDGQSKSNLITRAFTVTVNDVNQPPTINPIDNIYVYKNTTAKTVNLTGITSGSTSERQTLKITAVSGNSKVLGTPSISYRSPNSSGKLTFKPVKNATGTATITVSVNDGGLGNNIVKKTFTVTVLATGVAIPATLTTAPATVGGQFSMNVTGSTGSKYIVQASTDLKNWIPVKTNTAPFTFTDPQTAEFSQRYYRTVSTTP